ncbi:MAG: mannose-6-phosphate isomerase [Pedosphaera sp.]|nr:mannose-6-phosphate isomerase [Pedosphaera sp.]
MLPPLTFLPLFKERIWGGRRLAEIFGKALPSGTLIGESWEIADRPEGVSMVAEGPFAGRDLRWLMRHHGPELLGRPVAPDERFPWLCKILDAREDLSLQVHPPAALARERGGEPKTEMWYVAEADSNARMYVGLRRGVAREQFERQTREGTVATCFHHHHVQAGDVMFVPSGRVHALGAGQVIFEIQQNSDTTYRVFDWNRKGLDGRQRDLHLEQAFASIDFSDWEPDLVRSDYQEIGGGHIRPLVRDKIFHVDHHEVGPGSSQRVSTEGRPHLLAVTRGKLSLLSGGVVTLLPTGSFCLLPAVCGEVILSSSEPVGWLQVTPPA